MHIVARLAVFAASLLVASATSATELSGRSANASAGDCTAVDATVLEWKPKDGPMAAFIANAFASNRGNTFIALGYDHKGMWSAEIDAGSDACDCATLNLVVTALGTGKRTATRLAQSHDEAPSKADLETIKKQIFVLAKAPHAISRLRHDYHLQLPKRDAHGHIAHFSGWFAEFDPSGAAPMRFSIQSTKDMCWCTQKWTAYALKP